MIERIACLLSCLLKGGDATLGIVVQMLLVLLLALLLLLWYLSPVGGVPARAGDGLVTRFAVKRYPVRVAIRFGHYLTAVQLTPVGTDALSTAATHRALS